MSSININVDIDLDDIYDEMSRRDKEKMSGWLIDDGFCSENIIHDENVINNSGNLDYYELMLKMNRINPITISNEDLNILNSFVKKYYIG